MPAKIERCVAEVMKKQGLSKERAWAICTAAMDSGMLFDKDQASDAKIDSSTGFLTSPVTLARVGVQHYMGFELGLTDRAMDRIGVYRPASEVFHHDSVSSFTNLVVTDDHPTELVTIDNVKKLQTGTVSHVEVGDKSLSGMITITDAGQISKIKDGKLEVSVGYTNELKPESGVFDGEKYEFIQTKIRANHLAIVDAGRCGPACKIVMDNKKKEQIVKITIDGIEYDVEDKQLAQAIQKQQAAHDAEKEAFKKKEEEAEEEKEAMKKDKDKAEAAKDAMAKTVLDDAAINSLVAERAKLLTTAGRILGDKMPECMDCPKEIKTAVIDNVLDMGDLSGKSMDYVDAAYDMAVTKAAKDKESLDSLAKDFLTKDGKKVSRGSARNAYMKDQLGMEV